MGLFDIFKKKTKQKTLFSTAQETLLKQTGTIPVSEKKYYQADSYYQAKSHEGTLFENDVISFEQRKEISISSNNGLYVPEILMLHFCKKYPNPKSGYPGYWWYQYGIRDVNAVYVSLVEHGFISVSYKTGKYELTNLGKAELEENAYVPYMHSHSKYTTATGHLESVKKMAEEGRHCSELLVQISTVISALNNASKVILEDHINHCVVEAAKVDDKKVINDLIDAIGQYVGITIKKDDGIH